MFVFQRYYHLFWIPIFPINKTGVSVCSHCKQTLKLEEFSTKPALAAEYDRMVKQTKTPIWTFALLMIIGVFIIIGIISDATKKKNESTSENPSVENVQSSVVTNSSPNLASTDAITDKDALASMDEFNNVLIDYKKSLLTNNTSDINDAQKRYTDWVKKVGSTVVNLKGDEALQFSSFYSRAVQQWADAANKSTKD